MYVQYYSSLGNFKKCYYICYMYYTRCYCYCLIAVPVNGSCVAETDSIWRIYWPNSPPHTLVFQACPGGATLTIGGL